MKVPIPKGVGGRADTEESEQIFVGGAGFRDGVRVNIRIGGQRGSLRGLLLASVNVRLGLL